MFKKKSKKEAPEENKEEKAEDAPDQESGEQPEKKSIIKRLLSKKMILIIGGVLILGLAGGGAWFFFFSGSPEPETEPATEQAAAGQEGETVVPEILFEDIVTLEPFEMIPLKSGSSMRSVTLNVSIEILDPESRAQVYSREDRIRIIIQDKVREYTWLDLRSAEGKIRLKYDLLQSINHLFSKPMVRNLYFTTLIMQ